MTTPTPTMAFPAAFHVEVIDELPAGDVERVDFQPPGGIGTGTELLLEISTESGHWWLAVVRTPRPALRAAATAVHSTPSPTLLCAVVAGEALTIDVERPGEHEWLATGGPVTAVKPVVPEGLLLLATPWSITALGPSGERWQTARLAVDGLRLDEVADGVLAGVADPDDIEPWDFAVDLGTGEHRGGAPVA